MVVGGFISGRFTKNKIVHEERFYPKVWKDKFGESRRRRYIYVFFAGFLVLFGARLAGGCTSGHMMSGMMQTAVSGYLFAFAAFAAAIPVAIIIYKKQE